MATLSNIAEKIGLGLAMRQEIHYVQVTVRICPISPNTGLYT